MRVIDEMKAICGNVFVSKMDALAKDAISSREFAAYVRSECFGSRLFQRSQFHIISKGGAWRAALSVDASFANEFPDLALPPELLQLKEEFAALYQKKYSSRLLQFLFEKSEYTLQYTLPDRRAVDLVVSLPQYLVLNAFSTVDAFTAGDLQTLTNLPLSVVLETARCLAKPENGPLLALTPGATDNATTIALFESPSFSAPRVRLVPAPVLSAHTQAPMAAQDMSQMHKTRVDAAIVRIIKNAKFIGFSALLGKLNTVLDFLPEEQFVKERVESLISKDYLSRDEKDPSILVYQPWGVCCGFVCVDFHCGEGRTTHSLHIEGKTTCTTQQTQHRLHFLSLVLEKGPPMRAKHRLRLNHHTHTNHRHALPIQQHTKQHKRDNRQNVLRMDPLTLTECLITHMRVLVHPHQTERAEEGDHVHDGTMRQRARQEARVHGITEENQIRVARVVQQSADNIGNKKNPFLRVSPARRRITQECTKVRRKPVNTVSKNVNMSTNWMWMGFRIE